jgi:hypothetical protein
LRLFFSPAAAAGAAAAAGCSDTCTQPGVKVFELTVGDTVQDCSGYGPGLSTPATADECKKAISEIIQDPKMGFPFASRTNPNQYSFDECKGVSVKRTIGGGDNARYLFLSAEQRIGGDDTFTASNAATQFCKCSACPPPPPASSSTGTGWTLLGLALGAGSAGGAIAYGAAQTP